MKLLAATLSLFASASMLPLSARAGDAIPINPEKELQIVVHDQVMPRSRDSWTAPRMENERYTEFRSALEKSIKSAGYSGKVNITRFAANIPDAEQRLFVHVYRWESGLESFGRSVTAEIAMEATLTVGGKEWDLGTFTARESHYAAAGLSSEDYAPVARRAIDQMIEYYRNAIQNEAPKK